MRIAVASFSHETCTFCPRPTTIEDFERGGVLRGGEVLKAHRGIPSYINGFIKAAEEEGDVELVGILDASRSWGGSSGSWLTRECFDKYTYEIAEGLRSAGRMDGVLLALHGAMAVEGCLKPEAEIVRRVRGAVGDVPIMVTLDLHANEDHELTDVADGVFIIKTYPHVDSEQTGLKAARCLIATVRGEFKPVMAIRKPGVITPSVFQGTDFYPAKDIMDRAREWEGKGAYYVSVAFGFAYADVPDVGATVIALTDGDKELAERAAQDVSDYIWSLREAFAGRRIPKTREGVEQAIRAAREGRRPVILADHSDRTGDSTHILRELMAQGAENFVVATIADERAIEEISRRAKVGERVEVMLGGYAHPLSGEPVKISGIVEYLGPCEYIHNGPMARGAKVRLGKVAVLGLGLNNHVIVTPTLHQIIDDAIFPALGLNLKNIEIIAIKSRVHFRAFFKDVAGAIIEVDAPGLGPADLTQLEYKNIPDEIYPIGRKWRE
ncbi:M81 family metallopeptidase [Candidatus Bathyarchaeota archaeon]|nr:M81 family metallopeptidase [Candidatus Bathyarchaeota archaeon]